MQVYLPAIIIESLFAVAKLPEAGSTLRDQEQPARENKYETNFDIQQDIEEECFILFRTRELVGETSASLKGVTTTLTTAMTAFRPMQALYCSIYIDQRCPGPALEILFSHTAEFNMQFVIS